MNNLPKSKYPTTIFRVSLKAVIRNEDGEILCVKEQGSDWTLPGGGLDHGETIEEGLIRELREEVSFDAKAKLTYTPLGHDVLFVESKECWQLWVLFEVSFDTTLEFGISRDTEAVAFIHPGVFENSSDQAQKLIYKWCVRNA